MSITKFKTVFICLAGLSLSVPATVFAGAESGFYIGAGVGDATVEADGTDPTHGAYSFDGSDSAYKLFGGYNFGIVPFIDLAVEASYVDFGQPHSTFPSGEPIKLEVSGINAYGLAGASFGPFGIFAKAGVIDWDSDTTFDSTVASDSGTDPAYGLGVRLQFGSFAVRAEYEYFDVNDLKDLSMYSVSAVYTF